MSVQLPTEDQWTTYDYEVGEQRVANVKNEKYDFLERSPEMPMIINFSEQIEYVNTHLGELRTKLQVTGPDDFSEEFDLLAKNKTEEFATRTIKKYGAEMAEQVLSSTETGSLYFHIIHHFGSYNKFLDDISASNKRRKISHE